MDVEFWTIGVAVGILSIPVEYISSGGNPDWNYLLLYNIFVWIFIGLVYLVNIFLHRKG